MAGLGFYPTYPALDTQVPNVNALTNFLQTVPDTIQNTQDRSLLRQVGQAAAASPGLPPAAQAAYAGGNVALGAQMQNQALSAAKSSLEVRQQQADIFHRAASTATSQGDMDKIYSAMERVLPGSTQEYSGMPWDKARDQLISEGTQAKSQIIQGGGSEPGSTQNFAIDPYNPSQAAIPVGAPKLAAGNPLSPEGKVQADINSGVLSGQTADAALSKVTGKPTKAEAQSTLNTITEGMDNLKDVATQLLNHKASGITGEHEGTDLITGFNGALPAIPGGPKADAQALLDNLKTQSGIALVNQLKATAKNGTTGFGRITQYEFQQLQNVLSSLDQRQTNQQFRANVQKIIDFVDQSKKSNDAAFAADHGVSSSSEPAPAANGGKTSTGITYTVTP